MDLIELIVLIFCVVVLLLIQVGCHVLVRRYLTVVN